MIKPLQLFTIVFHLLFTFSTNSFCSSEQEIIDNIYTIATGLSNQVGSCPERNASLEEWNTFLQGNGPSQPGFLRPAEADHQELYNSPPYTQYPALKQSFKNLGLINSTYPLSSHFETVVIFGGTPWDTKERFTFLKNLIQTGRIKFSKVIYINGHRALKDIEKEWLLEQGYDDQAYQHEAAEVIWNELFTSPMKQTTLEIMTIPAPEGRRANTEDTVKEYFKSDNSSSTLFITNGPYGPFQGEIVKGVVGLLKVSKAYEVIQSETRDTMSLSSLLDTIARRVYAIKK
jgi:hypothetical protein